MHDAYFDPDACQLEDLAAATAQTTAPRDVPFASTITAQVPIYDVALLDLTGPDRRAIMAEWADVLRRGAGIVVLRGAYPDTAPIDAASDIFRTIIARETQSGGSAADHFSAGTNDRIWNALEKLCDADARVFAAYFGNVAIDAISEAWLGPNYQMTAQVNMVYPGGAAQEAHRDYHLGFQTSQVSAQYPAHVHDLSPVLTLQGAIAHCDMPVESGPTKLLPFSQTYRAGYAAWRLPAFRAYFEDHCLQIPLEKGDALFFNPALFHAAGANTSADIHRLANLLQVSSAFGRAMETIDRRKMCKALYPVLRDAALPAAQIAAAIASTAEGYSFPTNLDRDPPIGGLAPETQAALFHRALSANMPQAEFEAALDAQTARQQP